VPIQEIIVPSQGRVRAVLIRRGQYRFQDPDEVVRFIEEGRTRLSRNRFITADEAFARVRFDFDKGWIVDSEGRAVGVAAFRLRAAGSTLLRKNVSQHYRRADEAASRLRPRPNEEVVEEFTLIGRDGKLYKQTISHGLGERYNDNRQGGRWRAITSRALGLPPGDRTSTAALKEAVAYRDVQIKRTTIVRKD